MRRLSIVLAATLAFGGIAGMPRGAAAATPASFARVIVGTTAVVLAPARPMANERTKVSSTVPRGRRPVILERKTGTSWTKVTSGYSATSGKVSLAGRFSASTTVRLRAPRSGSKPAFVSRNAAVSLTGQSGAISVDPSVFVGEATQVRARFSPARLDRRVELEQLTPSGWIAVGTGREDSGGRASFQISGQTPGTVQFRAVALSYNGARSVATARAATRVLPADITLSKQVKILTDEQVADLVAGTASDGSTLKFGPGAAQPALVPGDLLSFLPSDLLPSGALVRVAAVQVGSDGSLTATTAPADLSELVENVPPGFDSLPVATYSTEVGELPEGVTLLQPVESGSGAPSVAPRRVAGSAGRVAVYSAPEIRLSYTREVTSGDNVYKIGGHAYVRPGVEVGYESRLNQPKDFKLGVVMAYDVGVEADASTKLLDSTLIDVPLPSITRFMYAQVGPLPVVFVGQFKPEVSLKVEAKVGVATSVSLISDRRFGIQRVDGVVRPYTAGGETPVVQPPRPYAAGKATLFAGFTGELDAYGLSGPYFRGGYELVAEIKQRIGDPLGWCIHHEPVAEWGFKTSDLIERLFKYSDKTTWAWDFSETDVVGLCGAIQPPRVSTVYLPRGLTGLAYWERLQNADGAAPFTWTATGLPPGLRLEGDTITGTPTGTGHFSPVVSVTDKYGRKASRTLTLDVAAPSSGAQALIGKIARLASGESWYVDKRGGRHAIPDGGTFTCLQAQGIAVQDTDSATAGELPVYEAARCVRANVGDIIRTSDGDAYLMNADWTRSWIPDGGSYTCLQVNGHPVVDNVPRYYVDDHVQGANATLSCYDAAAVKGKVVRGSDGKSWYVDKRGGKHWVPNGGTYDCIAGQTGGAYRYVVPASWLTQAQYEDAQCVRANVGDIIRTSDGDAYLMNADWTRSWIPDGGSYTCLQVNGHPVVDNVPRYYVDDHVQGANATLSCYDAAAVKGKVVRGSDGKSWYVDKRGGKHWVPNGGTYDCIAGQTGGAYRYVVPASWLTQAQYEDAQCVRPNPGDIIRHSDGDAYVVNGNWTRSWIPTAGSYACYRASGRALVDNVPRYYIDDMGQAGNAVFAAGQCIVRQPDGTSWQVNNDGKREWIPDSPTWDCEVGRGTPVLNVTAAYAASIGQAGWHYCLNQANLQNKILRNMDNGAAYLTYGNNTKTWIPDEFTYNCRVRQGYPVVNTHWQQYIDSFSGSTWDSCFDIETFKNKFIKEDPDGDAYFVDERGVKHWVPQAAYGCMVGRFGEPHITKRRNYIDAMASGDWAVCGDTLRPGQNMDRGQWLTSSANGYTLHMQYDGNLVMYNGSGGVVWASNTAGSAAVKVRLDGNGALSIQNSSGGWVKHVCNSWGSNANRFVVQGDSNLVLYRDNAALWARNQALCAN